MRRLNSPLLTASLLLGFCVASGRAVAEFTASRRSINGTGETLPAGETELGLGSGAYGVTDDLMVRVPTLSLLVGYGRVEARYKSVPGPGLRASPYVFVETPRHGGVGGDLGWDFGSQMENSITLGGRFRHGPLATANGNGIPARRRRTVFRPNAEYDRYLNGNVAYVGMSDYLVYAGYTWAWTSFHCGLVVSPAAGLLPLPYVYWRF